MPDIELRFNRDMLVMSAPLDAALERQGFDAERDRQYLNLMESDSVLDAMRMEAAAGAQCLVTPTSDITTARLAHVRMENNASELAAAAHDIVAQQKPQHVIVEIGPCGLPLDASSKASLNENRSQYAAAARLFADKQVDAFFLNGFASTSDLRCALMGVGQVSARPVIASVDVAADGSLPSPSWLISGRRSQASRRRRHLMRRRCSPNRCATRWTRPSSCSSSCASVRRVKAVRRPKTRITAPMPWKVPP